MPKKLSHYSLILVLLFIGAAIRLSNTNFVLVNMTGHLNFIDTDCYYYLRRFAHFVQNFPSLMIFDPIADWPTGSVVDWPEGFLLLLGIPLKLMGVDSFQSLEVSISVLMLILGLISALVIYFCSLRLMRSILSCYLVLFFACTNFLLVRFSCLGQVDHHILESLFPPLILFLSYLSFIDRYRAASIVLGFVLAFSLSVSSSSLFVIFSFFMAYALVFGSRQNIFLFAQTIGTFFVILIPYAIWGVRSKGDPMAVTYASYFHVALM